MSVYTDRHGQSYAHAGCVSTTPSDTGSGVRVHRTATEARDFTLAAVAAARDEQDALAEADASTYGAPFSGPSVQYPCSHGACRDGLDDCTVAPQAPRRTPHLPATRIATTEPVSHAVIAVSHGPNQSTWNVVSVHGSEQDARDGRRASILTHGARSLSVNLSYASDYGVYLTADDVVTRDATTTEAGLLAPSVARVAALLTSGMLPSYGATRRVRRAPIHRPFCSYPVRRFGQPSHYSRASEFTPIVRRRSVPFAFALPSVAVAYCEDCGNRESFGQDYDAAVEFTYCEDCDRNCDRCCEHTGDVNIWIESESESWCEYCTNQYAVYLDCCGEYSATRGLSYARCDGCSNTVGSHCHGWSSCDCGNEMCDDCGVCECEYSSDSDGGYDGIADSCASPPMTFFGDHTPWHFGLELELAGVRYSTGGAINRDDALSSHVVAKTDGSVDGVEFAFSPMTLAYMRDWSGLSDLLGRVASEARDSSGAGIHVHVSDVAFTDDDHRETFGALLGSDVNTHRVSQYARRSSEQWARAVPLSHVSEHITGERSQRYTAVNWTARRAHGTAEVRVFRSTTDRETILNTVALVAAAVDYTREMSGTLPGMDWDAFGAWCLTREDFHGVAETIVRTVTA